MESAISMFLAETITADDERLNYLSYEELSLICPWGGNNQPETLTL